MFLVSSGAFIDEFVRAVTNDSPSPGTGLDTKHGFFFTINIPMIALLVVVDTLTDISVCFTWLSVEHYGTACASFAILLVSGLATGSLYASMQSGKMSRPVAYVLGLTFLALPLEYIFRYIRWLRYTRATDDEERTELKVQDAQSVQNINKLRMNMALLESTPQILLVANRVTAIGFRNTFKSSPIMYVSLAVSVFSIVLTNVQFLITSDMEHDWSADRPLPYRPLSLSLPLSALSSS